MNTKKEPSCVDGSSWGGRKVGLTDSNREEKTVLTFRTFIISIKVTQTQVLQKKNDSLIHGDFFLGEQIQLL